MITKRQPAESGIAAIFVVLCLVVLAAGLVPSALSLSGTLSRDSEVKTGMVRRHYSAISGEALFRSKLLNEDGYLESFVPGAPSTQQVMLNGDVVNVTVTELDPIGSVVVGTSIQADIVLALDVSDGVSAAELLLLKDAAVTVVDHLDLSGDTDSIRMGVSRFAGSSESVAAMTDADDPDADPPVTAVTDGIEGLVQGGPGLVPGTNLVLALQGAAAQFGTGLGDRPGVPNLILMITDGDDNAGNNSGAIDNPSTLADESEATGAEVFVVGVGDKIKTNSLNAIATDDDPSDPAYVEDDPNAGHRFHTNDFSGLLAIVDELAEAVIRAAQTRMFRIVSEVNGYVVESIVSVGFDGTAATQSWAIN